ncbi:MAG: GntR family transcriptional regulator [Pseudomonadota bacterium]
MKLNRTCMRDPIRDTLVSRILDGVYPEGMHLKELALAREFNVSQAPVREALRELEALGLVETERYRGTRVRQLDLGELREAYELRRLLETASIRSTPFFSDKDLTELDLQVQSIEAATLRGGDCINDLMDDVLRFHRKLVEMSGNRLFLKAWESMAWGVRSRIMAKKIGFVTGLNELRAGVVDSLRRGQREQAAAFLGQITDRLLESLNEQHRQDKLA